MILIDATQEYQDEHGPWGGVECIFLDSDKPETLKTVYQYWNLANTRQLIKYIVSCSINGNDVHITYDRDLNPHLQNDVYKEVVWGTHILREFNPDSGHGSSTWIPEDGDGMDVPGPGWQIREERESIFGVHGKINGRKREN